jgi:hypothetical protein
MKLDSENRKYYDRLTKLSSHPLKTVFCALLNTKRVADGWTVQSMTEAGKSYRVSDQGECECIGWFRKSECVHSRAARLRSLEFRKDRI